MTVRTRFAPSPTGYLHIGGVRTALFNWLFARKHGGQFILRIDDTDQQRNVQEALQPILDGFRWLGLDWDEGAEIGGPNGPYYQSERLARYQAAVALLLEKGAAYWDYARPEETKAEMELAEKEKRPKIYSRKWMAHTTDDRKRFEAEGRPAAVKIKMPREGTCRFVDHVRGEMEVQWAGEQDIVIQRSDGTVTYNLANVVDDYDMKISHVIRAEEHLANTPRQLFLLDSLGYPRPEYAHLPPVAEPGSKNKLSKRKIPQYLKNSDFKKIYEHGKAITDRLGLLTTSESFNPVLVAFYEHVGYLPGAVLNDLVLLGWSLDDKTEEFTKSQMIESFTLERIVKAPASLDVKKLFAFQAKHMQVLSVTEKVLGVRPFLEKVGIAAPDAYLTQIVEGIGPRLVVFGDILEYDYFFIADEQIVFNSTLAQKNLNTAFKGCDRAVSLVAVFANLQEILVKVEMFDAPSLKAETERVAEAIGAKAGPLSQLLRIATTGKDVGFSAYDTLAILGRERCLKRVDQAIRAMGIV